jgi:hypothetical protein
LRKDGAEVEARARGIDAGLEGGLDFEGLLEVREGCAQLPLPAGAVRRARGGGGPSVVAGEVVEGDRSG